MLKFIPSRRSAESGSSSSLQKHLLKHLPAGYIARLQLQPGSLPLNRPLERFDRGTQHIFFIESGVGSMTSMFKDGSELEVGLFGRVRHRRFRFMGVRRSLNHIYMQMEGAGYASPILDAQREFNRGGEFQRLALATCRCS